MMKEKKRRRSLGRKLNYLIVVIVLFVSISLIATTYNVFCNRIDEYYHSQVINAANAGSDELDPDIIRSFRDVVLSEEFREVRDQAKAADNAELLYAWMKDRPSDWFQEEYAGTHAAETNQWTFLNDYYLFLYRLDALSVRMRVDSIYYQFDMDGNTYNIADTVDDPFYLGTVERPFEEFADYYGNVEVPPIIYRSEFGWLCTAVTPIIDPDTDEVICVSCADLDMSEVMRERYAFFIQCSFLVICVIVIAIISSMHILRRIAVKPLRELADATTTFANDDENSLSKDDIIDLNINSNDEIGDLYHEIQSMQGRIVDYTDNLKRITAEEERVNTELRTASQIQEAMLPHTFPAFPNLHEIDLYATMDPAKEVGGDFYDFFMIDDDHLAFVIADVSDKGIPAALFMMSSKILINYRTLEGGTPSEILGAVNAQICKSNMTHMFVTVWLGILELSTGLLRCSNAGHEYPILRGQDGVFRVFEDKHSLAVGALAKTKYSDYEIQLNPGDAVFVYTDGLPEANNPDKEFFGMDRTVSALNRLADLTPKEILEGMQKEVFAFTGDANQFDDLTMLCFDYKGKQPDPESDSSKDPVTP